MARSARALALQALQDRQGMVSRHLERLLAREPIPPADAGLATELAHGVVRRRRTLDAVIRGYSQRPDRGMPDALRQVLRLGVYQVLFLDRVPDFAAVSESVELCRRKVPHATGFVNALLRSVARGAGEPATGAAVPLEPNVVPLTDAAWRALDRPFLAPPGEQPGIFLGEACSLPDELAGRWLRRFGGLPQAFAAAMQCNARPPLVARVNAARTSVAGLLERLRGEGVAAEPHANGRSVVLPPHTALTALPAFQEGLLTPQDATATDAAAALGVLPGQAVLDFCAAPGTKTTQIGEALGGQGRLLAVDVSREKLALVEQGTARYGIALETRLAEEVAALPPESFDRVLVDAPCSNSGVFARRVEARWRFTTESLRRLAGDQRQILTLAAMFAARGGRIVYSTCSVEPEENGEVVRGFVKANRRWRLLEERLTLPSGHVPPTEYRDGGYWALLGPA